MARDLTARATAPCCRNQSNFRWADGSAAFPALVPSSQEYNYSDYSHWNRAGSVSEPNGQNCVYAGERAYYYFAGVVEGDRVLTGYVQTSTSKDVLGWVDVQCDYKVAALHYICEFEGKAWVFGRGAARCLLLSPDHTSFLLPGHGWCCSD